MVRRERSSRMSNMMEVGFCLSCLSIEGPGGCQCSVDLECDRAKVHLRRIIRDKEK